MIPDRKSFIRPLIPSKWYKISICLKFNLFPMCSHNLIYIGLCLPFFFLSPFPSLSPFLSLLFFLSLLLFSDFAFLKRIHQHRLGAASVEFPRISGSPNSGKSLPLQLGVEEVSVLWLSIFLGLSRLGSAPNSVPGASLAQLPYAARAASSVVRLRLSLRSSLLAGIVSAAQPGCPTSR